MQVDERRLYTVAPKFEGWIQRLYVNTMGQAVKKGDALMDVYSPELITAQHEYLIARKGLRSVEHGSRETQAGMQHLAESALQRLRNWDISEIELQHLQQDGEVKQHLTLRSAANGLVLDKLAIQGERFMSGQIYIGSPICRVCGCWATFSNTIWASCGRARWLYRIDAYPDKVFNGKVAFIYPTVKPETRTAKVRIELPNKQGLLKPDMYGRVELASYHTKDKVLTVPDSAVLDTGIRHLVLVELGEGRYEPRTVKLGIRADGYAEVLGGLKAGETVVVSANFLIDAESNLKAALGGFGHNALASTSGKNGWVESSASTTAPARASHRGVGRIEALDWVHATVTIAHDPIAVLTGQRWSWIFVSGTRRCCGR